MSTKPNMKWTVSKEESLIALVHQNPELWDKTLDQSRYSKKIGEKWEEIASILNVSKDQARNKWRNLQTQFGKEYANKPLSRSGDAAPKPTSAWCHFESMSFLKEKSFNVETSGNLDFVNNNNESQFQSDQMMNATKSNQENVDESTKNVSCTDVQYEQQLENADDKAEWQFLLSTLSYTDKISGKNTKFQFRLEALCLLFNYMTNNEVAKENIHEDRKYDKKDKNCVKKDKNNKEYNVQDKNCVKKEKNYEECNVQDKKLPVKSEIDNNTISITQENNECKIIDVKISSNTKQWLLKNPLVLKKEKPF